MSQRRTNEEWLNLCKEVHGDEVDYSETDFNQRDEKGRVKLICPKHGVFYQNLMNHVYLKQGCPKCKGGVQSNKEEFIRKSKEMYGENALIYDRVNYINNHTEVELGCQIHNVYFKVTPRNHLNKILRVSCPFCKNRINIEPIFNKIKEEYTSPLITVLGYHRERDKNFKYFIDFNCKLHGNFSIRLDHLLRRKREEICEECKIMHNKQDKEVKSALYREENKVVMNDRYSFIWLSIQTYGQYKYGYWNVKYINRSTNVSLYCFNHKGYFEVHPARHLSDKKVECSECFGSYVYKDTQDWLDRNLSEYLKSKFIFDKAVYINKNTPMEIVCPKHGSFFRYPFAIKKGIIQCPKCEGSYFENVVSFELDKNNIVYIPQCNKKTFIWLDRKSLDFYLPHYNIAIECQGKQHFGFGCWSKDENKQKETFQKVSKNDIIKRQLCKDNDIKLIYFLHENYTQYLNEDDIYFTNAEELINYILEQPKFNTEDEASDSKAD